MNYMYESRIDNVGTGMSTVHNSSLVCILRTRLSISYSVTR